VATAIIPIILTVGLGFLLECRRRMDVSALSSIAIYVLLPCLIFSSLLTTEITLHEALPLIAVVLLVTSSLWLLGKAFALLRRLPPDQESFFLLTTLFMNCGNMGMPVALYAFGDLGLHLSIIWVLVINSLANTLGIYYASRHRGGRRQALRTIFSLPTVYAAALALIIRALHLSFPDLLLPPLQLLGLAIIPIGQLLLGIQLAKARTQVNLHLSGALLPNFIRLLLAPAITFAFAHLLGLEGTTARVAILMSAMPTAVNSAVYATEFGLHPRRIATTVFTSTLASFVTLSALLLLLD